MTRFSFIGDYLSSKLRLLLIIGLFSIGDRCHSSESQAVDNECGVTTSRSQSENFFSRDDNLQNRLQDFLKVKIYAFNGLKGAEARESALDIIDSIMSWYYHDSLKTLRRDQVLTKVLQDFRECYVFYYQYRANNESILRLLAPFYTVKKILGK